MLILPIFLPLCCASLCILVSLFWQRNLALVASVSQVGAAIALGMQVWKEGPQVLRAGNWPVPFGIVLVADLLSALLVLLASLVFLGGTVYLLSSIDEGRERRGFYVFLFALSTGVNGAFLTGDVFNLYVWFEVLLISSFVLLALHGGKSQLDATLRYVVLNLVSSMFLLAGIGLLYGMVGTLNLADIAVKLSKLDNAIGPISAVGSLFLVAFGVKAALIPLFFWLPASYHTMPGGLAAVFAALLTKVGLYAILRLFSLIFVPAQPLFLEVLSYLGALTFLVGSAGALSHQNLRQSLSYLVISSIGLVVMGISLWSPLALCGALFYLAHDILAKAGLFITADIVERNSGPPGSSEAGDGWYARFPGLSIAFFVLAFSIAGFPPFSGFWGKLTLFWAALEASKPWLVGALLAGSCLTLLTFGRMWNETFAAGKSEVPPTAPGGRQVGCAFVFAAFSLLLGLHPEPLLAAVERMGKELLDTSLYISTVLGGGS